MLKHFLRNKSGSALVELALTAPVLMFMLIASAELARIAYYAIEVQNAARAGAAYGAASTQNAFGPASAANMEQAAENDVPNITDLTFQPAPTTACVCETTNSSGGISYSPTSGTASCSSMTSCTAVDGVNGSTKTDHTIEYVVINTRVTVKTMFHYGFPAWGLALPSSFTLNGYAQMRVIQN